MSGPHLTNAEFDQVLAHGAASLPTLRFSHAEGCSQCRQELRELSAVFAWPSGSPVDPQRSEELADRVLSRWAKERIRRRILAVGVPVVLCGIALLIAGAGGPINGMIADRFPILLSLSSFQAFAAALLNLFLTPFLSLAKAGGGIVILSILVLFSIWGGDLLLRGARRQMRSGGQLTGAMTNRLLRQ